MTDQIDCVRDNCIEQCLVGTALDGMCVGLVMMNAAARITWMNRAAERLLGVEKPLAYGQLLGQVLKDPQFSAFWQDAHEQNETVMGAVSIRFPEATDLKVNSTQCLDHAGELIGWVLLFCDVTHERAAQVELSREISDRLLNLAPVDERDPVPSAGLTAQELQILRLVGQGLSNQEISARLSVALSTLRSHLKHIYRKTGLRSRTEAVRYAIRNGL